MKVAPSRKDKKRHDDAKARSICSGGLDFISTVILVLFTFHKAFIRNGCYFCLC